MKAQSLVLAVALMSAGPVLYGNAAEADVSRHESAAILQQVKKITGVIKDATGEPIIGANVIVKGTTNGTMSDIDGQFSLFDRNNSCYMCYRSGGAVNLESIIY